MTSQPLLGLTLLLTSFHSSLFGQGIYWALDEQDHNRIWGWSDYTDGTSAVDYGVFQYDDGSGYRDFPLDTRDIEAMAITPDNIGYMFDEFDALWSYDFNGLTPGTSNRYQLTTISLNVGLGGEALGYNQADGFLYLAETVGAADESDTTADRLYRIDPANGNTVLIGTVSGLGHILAYTDGLEFDHLGNLYAYDQNDDHLYQISTVDASIISLLDNDVLGGLSAGADIETLAWDSATNRLIGIDNLNQEIVHLTIGNGGNSVLTNFSGTLGPGTDFEGTGMGTVPEPSAVIVLGAGAAFLLFPRKRRHG